MFHLNRRILTPFLLVASLQFAMLASGCGQKAVTQVDGPSLTSTTNNTSSSFDNSIFTGATTETPLASSSGKTTAATSSTTIAIPDVQNPPLATSSAATPSVPATVSTPVSTSSIPTNPAHGVIDPAFMLKANVVKTVTHGILWFKTVEATVQVQNPLFLYRQTGTLTVSFYSKGLLVETQQLLVALDPAEIRDFSVESTKHADAASASVSTN